MKDRSKPTRRQLLAGGGGVAGLASQPAIARADSEPIRIRFSPDTTDSTVPAFCGCLSYDMVTALEATDHVGTIGRLQFYGRAGRFVHAVRYGRAFVPSVMIQWQKAAMKTIWPLKYATAKVAFPSFVKLPA